MPRNQTYDAPTDVIDTALDGAVSRQGAFFLQDLREDGSYQIVHRDTTRTGASRRPVATVAREELTADVTVQDTSYEDAVRDAVDAWADRFDIEVSYTDDAGLADDF